jgi:esterase/lipase
MLSLIITTESGFSVNETIFQTLSVLQKSYEQKLEKLKKFKSINTALEVASTDQKIITTFFRNLCKEVRSYENRMKESLKQKMKEFKRNFYQLISNFAHYRKEIKMQINRNKTHEK